MNILIYVCIFIIGIICGSIFSVAICRISKGQKLLSSKSYCPKCKHSLSILDVIPLFSYIGLRGRCRYCKQKINPSYFLTELLSGIIFVLFTVSIRFSIETIKLSTIIYLVIGLLYIAGLFVIAGIDKTNKHIKSQLLLYVFVLEVIYILYLAIVEKANILRYVIYFVVLVILNLFNILYYKKKVRNNYTLEILILLIEMCIFTFEICTAYSIIFALLIIAIYSIITFLKRKKYVKIDKNEKAVIPFGFYLSVSNIIILIISNMIIFYR